MPDAISFPVNATQSARYQEILVAAAECFQLRGYSATSIDAVARHLGATKGRVYHYFPSKMDLFNAVLERGMEIVFEASEADYGVDLPAADRLTLISLAHVKVMFAHHAFMQVQLEGLQMHRFSSTTPEQREAHARHIARRDAYEDRFREVISEGIAQGDLVVRQPLGVTIQTFFSALNGPVTWYFERPGDSPEKLDTLAREVTRFALLGLGLDLDKRGWPTRPAQKIGETEA